MSLLPANATFDLYRGVQDDGYGDTEDDDDAPLYTGLRGTLSYRVRTVMDPATRTPQQVESYFCLFSPDSDVRNGDRLRDAESGEWFNVAGSTKLRTLGFSRDVSVTLSRVGG